jgi:predicted unusual protein kinase regulating ubiquinone biosynthesis (AarF/ABC1/UbiB family)
MADARDVPKGKLARLGGLARVALRCGAALLGPADADKAAAHALEVLGNLRGLAAKVGQMASYVDGFVPEPHGEAFARALSSLQTGTPPSPFSAVRAVLEAELGVPVSEAFAELEVEPFASASIGQVHRARLPDGRAVAVKVQHPGVAESMDADLGSAGALARIGALLAPKGANVQEVMAELAARFREELDYRHEAGWQQAFAALHASDPRVHVPAVVDSHTRPRVLTTELVRALPFSELCTRSEAERRAAAELLWTAVFRPIVHGGVFNADPHPGNFLFHPDGRLTLLDFGCVQTLSPPYFQHAPSLHRAAIDGDERSFAEAARAVMGTEEGAYERALVAFMWQAYAPLRSARYHMRRDYVAEVVNATKDLSRHMLTRDAHVTRLPEGLVLLNRLQFGFWSLLARLDVEASYAGAHRALLGSRPAAPVQLRPLAAATPSGAQAAALLPSAPP